MSTSGVAELDRAGDGRRVLQEPAPAGELEDGPDRTFELGLDRGPSGLVAGLGCERCVPAGDAEVDAREGELGVVDDGGQERPQLVEPGESRPIGGAQRLERRAKSIPAGQLDPGLGPGEAPRDRPKALDVDGRCRLGSPRIPRRRPRAESELGQDVDRGDPGEEAAEARVVVDERPVGAR